MQSNSTMVAYLDFWVAAGLLLALLSFLWCAVYGLIFWNRGYGEKDGDYKAEIEWEHEEIELIERLP
ncbi:MAG TPA: hypothetical protein VMT62_04435 [Syntrophorhabdaceae bacterium]|nr:hypothetical protein [Syntrophorhabdaceae bacterium]